MPRLSTSTGTRSPGARVTSPPISEALSTTHSRIERSSTRSRTDGSLTSRMKASTLVIISSIWAMSCAMPSWNCGGIRSSRNRMRASGVRKSWLMAPTMAVRSSI